LLDLSPNNTYQILRADEFDGALFAETDSSFGIELRDLEIRFELAKNRYKELFDKEFVR
jgi:hypothetical protein